MISPRGRALQMNSGANQARGDILLFLHADTFLAEGSFKMIDNCLADQRYVAGAFSLSISSRRFVYRIIEGVASVRTRLSRIPYGDQAIFIRKNYFDKIGRYRDIPLMEDVDLKRRIRTRGDRIVLLPLKVRTTSRRWESEGVVYCTLRNWFLRLFYSMGVSPEKLVVEGNCDERGTLEYNLALGERGANHTKYLLSLGIPAERISTISYGEEKPLDPGHIEAAWAENRRAHFVILSK